MKRILNYPLIVFEGKNKSFTLKIKHLLYPTIYYSILLLLNYQKEVISQNMFLLALDYDWSLNTLSIWRNNLLYIIDVLYRFTFIIPMMTSIILSLILIVPTVLTLCFLFIIMIIENLACVITDYFEKHKIKIRRYKD